MTTTKPAPNMEAVQAVLANPEKYTGTLETKPELGELLTQMATLEFGQRIEFTIKSRPKALESSFSEFDKRHFFHAMQEVMVASELDFPDVHIKESGTAGIPTTVKHVDHPETDQFSLSDEELKNKLDELNNKTRQYMTLSLLPAKPESISIEYIREQLGQKGIDIKEYTITLSASGIGAEDPAKPIHIMIYPKMKKADLLYSFSCSQ